MNRCWEKMTIRNKRLGSAAAVCIFAFIIIDNRFFYFFQSEDIYRYLVWMNVNLIVAGVSFLLFVYYEIRCHKMLHQYTKGIIPYLIMLSIVLIGLVSYTTSQYPFQRFRNTIQQVSTYPVIIMAVPVLILFIRHGGTEKFMEFLNVIAAVWYVMIIVQRYILLFTGSYLFGFSNYASENIFTTNTVRPGRILLPVYGSIMIIYNFVKVYVGIMNKRVRKFHVIQFVLGIYCMVFVSQSRGPMLAIGFSIAGIVLSWKKPALFKEKEILLSFLLVLAAVFSGIITEFVVSFSTKGDMAFSTTARLDAIQYFWKCFCNNPLFGNGLAIDNRYVDVIRGPEKTAYYCDVGIVGLMGHIGLCSIVVYIIPLIRIIRRSAQIYRKSADREVVFFSVGIAIYLLTSSPTYIILEEGPVFFPIIWSYLEYHYVQAVKGQKIMTASAHIDLF